MKPKLTLRLALIGTVALFTHTTFAQTWQTVDDYVYPGLYGSAYAQAITKAPFGNIYVAGAAFVDGNGDSDALIRKSSDGSVTWSVVDDFSNGETHPGWEYNGIAADSTGTVY